MHSAMTAEERVRKIYGSFAQYEQFKEQVGMTPDHAAHFERHGVILQPQQMRFAVRAREADFEPNPREVGIGGGKGGGKTFGVVAQVGLDDCQRFPGIKALYLRKTEAAAKEQMSDVIGAVFGRFEDKHVNTERIKFGNGSQIIIGGFKDDSQALAYQGIEYDILIIAELTQLSLHTYTILRTAERSSKVFDGVPFRPRTYVDANPLGIGHMWVKERFVDPQRRRDAGEAEDGPAKTIFIFSKPEDNVFLNVDYLANLDDLVGAEYEAYRRSNWDVTGGAYFDTFHYDSHTFIPADVTPDDKIPDGWSVWASMDYGLNHPNVVYLHAEDGDGNPFTLDELWHRRKYPEEIAADIHAMFARYGLTVDDLDQFYAGSDVFNKTGAAKRTVAEQYAEFGIYLTRAAMGPGTRVAGAHQLLRLLGDPNNKDEALRKPARWRISRRCKKLIETLPYLQKDPNNTEDVLKVNADERGRGGDDAYDAARYGIYRPYRATIG